MMKCSKVVDISAFRSINSSRKYFLDTNVLYWYTYPRFLQPNKFDPAGKIYYDFVDSLAEAGNPMETSIYNLTELLNVIEKNEFKLFTSVEGDTYKIKDFRAIESERQKVKSMMATTLNNVKSICTIKEFEFTSQAVNDFVDNLTEHQCDVFDFSILRNCQATSCLNIISDDGDFFTMDEITLYTANQNVLEKYSRC